ncbi:MAG: hypothetical protein K0S54_1047 [Alphaproteobacteria bacterium]|jgi:hypothetical protein|nr:hypothetical protein [Alphaproteobacteria bacterium]
MGYTDSACDPSSFDGLRMRIFTLGEAAYRSTPTIRSAILACRSATASSLHAPPGA